MAGTLVESRNGESEMRKVESGKWKAAVLVGAGEIRMQMQMQHFKG